MKLIESINRSFNLLATSIVVLSGVAFLPEVFLEKDWDDKADDVLLFILGIIAVIWYNRNGNSYKRSFMPVVLVILSLLTKIAAVIIEFSDKESVGDDFGALILFILSLGLIIFQYQKTKKLLAGGATNPEQQII